MSNFEDHAKRLDIRGLVITSNITALSIVLALLWKDAITEMLTGLLPHGTGLLSLFSTALAGTAVVATIVYIMLRIQEINRKKIYSFKERVKIRSYKPGMLRKIREFRISNGFKYKYKPRKPTFSFK